MARPSKTAAVIESEGKSHRTKAEMEARRNAEKAFATGHVLTERPEVKADKVAHKEFMRVSKLLASVGKNDALFESIINRYCMISAECVKFEEMRDRFDAAFNEMSDNDELDAETKYTLQMKMQQSIINVDKQLQTKRLMLLNIEKECSMTIAAAMRTIPKQPTERKNPLESILGDDDDD